MRINLRQHLTTTIAVALGVMIGSVGPGVAQAAYDAVNADKVDGKHAVGAGATVAQRKGKLVATSPTTGLLPNGIIAKAPDSARLGGSLPSVLRSLPLSVHGAFISGAAGKSATGVSLSPSGASTLTVSFIVPADHPANTPLQVDMAFLESSINACGVYLFVDGLSNNAGGGALTNGGWKILPSTNYDGVMQVPAEPADVHTQTFEWAFGSVPGQIVDFELTRAGDLPGDDCSGVQVLGLQLRY